MPRPTEAVAIFPTEAEALLALGLLDAEGIRGEILPASDNLSRLAIILPVLDAYHLVVAPDDAESARRILFLHAREPLAPGWEDVAERAIDGWICPCCDTQSSMNEASCHACGSPHPNLAAWGEEEVDD